MQRGWSDREEKRKGTLGKCRWSGVTEKRKERILG
jgi:hypothetical protein